MPLWAILVTTIGGIVCYGAIGFLAGAFCANYLDRSCRTGTNKVRTGISHCSHYDHDPAGIPLGIFWPVGLPGFVCWCLARSTHRWNPERSLSWTSPQSGG